MGSNAHGKWVKVDHGWGLFSDLAACESCVGILPECFSPPSNRLFALAKVSSKQLDGIAHNRAPAHGVKEDISIFGIHVGILDHCPNEEVGMGSSYLGHRVGWVEVADLPDLSDYSIAELTILKRTGRFDPIWSLVV